MSEPLQVKFRHKKKRRTGWQWGRPNFLRISWPGTNGAFAVIMVNLRGAEELLQLQQLIQRDESRRFALELLTPEEGFTYFSEQ